jgi:hypothetical protein
MLLFYSVVNSESDPYSIKPFMPIVRVVFCRKYIVLFPRIKYWNY